MAHPPQDLVKAVELMSKCTAWRSAAQSLGNAISDEQITYAQIFEDHLQLRPSRVGTRKKPGHGGETALFVRPRVL